MHFTGEELDKLIKSIEKEFGTELALAKSEHEFPPKDKEEKPEHKEEPKEEHREEAPKEEEAHAEEAHEPAQEEAEHSEKEHEAPAEHQEMAPVADHGYDDEDMEHMHKMYMSMSPGEQKAHHDALRKCMDMSMGKSEKEIEEQAPGKTPGAKSEASKANGEKLPLKMSKAENPRRGSGGQSSKQEPANSPGPKSEASYTKNKVLYKSDEDGIEEQQPDNIPGAKSEASYTPNKELYDMGKSEDFDMLKSEVEAQKAKNETLQKTLDGVTEFLTKLAEKTSAPKGKAVTSYEAITKGEEVVGGSQTQPLSKSEITAVLAKKASDPTLSKSDRDAINAFYWNEADLNSISHLLKSSGK